MDCIIIEKNDLLCYNNIWIGSDNLDWKICGLIDIILIVGFLLSSILGFKKGFIKKALGLVGLLTGLIVAFVYCNGLASWFQDKGFIYNGIYDKIFQNASTAVAELGDGSIEDALVHMGIWKFVASILAKNIQATTTLEIAASISAYIAHLLMVLISFAILFVGVFIVAIILKILASILRENKIFKLFDGILGIVLYSCLFILAFDSLFMILRFFAPLDFFAKPQQFLNVDMKLTEDTFRISKYFYLHNPIYEILNIFF